MDLPIPFAFAIQQGINTVLRLDPHTKDALSDIEGKVIRVEVTAPALSFHLIVLDGAVDVEGAFDAEADTTITGSAGDLLSLRQKNDAIYTGDVKITGDTSTGEKLRSIINGLEVDLEELVAPITGDAVAHRLGLFGAQVGAWLKDTSSSLKTNTSEYLQEEVELTAPNSEVKRYCSEVDEARELYDRIDARVSVLEKAKKPT